MKLDWKLQSLKYIMRSADKVPSRRNKFREGNGIIRFREVKEFRKKLVKTVSKKLKLTVPKVKLSRFQPSLHDLSSENSSKCDDSDQVDVSVSVANSKIESSSSNFKIEKTKRTSDERIGAPKLEVSVSEPFLAKCEGTSLENLEVVSYSPITTKEVNTNTGEEEVSLEFTCNELMKDMDDDDDDDIHESSIHNESSYSPSPEADTVPPTHNISMDESPIPIRRAQPSPPEGFKTEAMTSSPEIENTIARRLRKRKCSVENNFLPPDNLKIEKKFCDQNSQDGVSSLKELALQHFLHLKYKCTVTDCSAQTNTFYHAEDLHQHHRHHGIFHCSFCDFQTDYASKLSKHEVQKHSVKDEHKFKNKKGQSIKSFKCPRCNLVAWKAALEIHHLKSHLNLNPNQRTCPICKNAISKDIRAHFLEHHDLTGVDLNTVEHCKELNCRAYFRSSVQLDNHQISVHQFSRGGVLRRRKHLLKKKNFAVSFWSMGSTLPALSPHALKKMENEKVCTFGTCGNVFFSDEDLERHLKHHGDFKCKKCWEVLNDPMKLALHEMTHQKKGDSPKLTCARCKLSVPNTHRSRGVLIRHFVKTHLGLPMDFHTCPVCDAKILNIKKQNESISLNNAYGLRAHLKRNHDFSKTTHKCTEPDCHAYFNTYLPLEMHRNSHKMLTKSNTDSSDNNSNIQQCRFCPKQFKERANMIRHVNSLHSKYFPYACPSESCKERFETEKELEWHTSGNQIVICPVCGKSYHSYGGLHRHMNTHSENRKPNKVYVCEICGKECKGTSALRLHALAHSGPESWEFSCDVCEKKCITQQKLDEHKRTHLKEKPFTCQFCGVSYAHRHNLRIHINGKHSDIASDPPMRRHKNKTDPKKKTMPKNTTGNKTIPSEKATRRQARKNLPSLSSSIN